MKTTWIKLTQIAPGANSNIYVGCTEFRNERDYLYPDRVLKYNSTIIWIPDRRVHIGVASYVDAQRDGDQTALAKLAELGIPLGIRFSADNDFSGTYELASEKKRRAARKTPRPVKVMRAKFAQRFDDGSEFRAGDIVKITFRKKFEKDVASEKTFRNSYERPTEDEVREFLASEACA